MKSCINRRAGSWNPVLAVVVGGIWFWLLLGHITSLFNQHGLATVAAAK